MATATEKAPAKSKKLTSFGALKVNEVLSEQQFWKVNAIKGDKVQLKGDNGDLVVVDKAYAEAHLISATQHSDAKSVTKTEAAQLFISNPGVAITVSFNMKVKEDDVVKQIMEAYEGSTPKGMETSVKKAVKEGLLGVERTMVGRHYGSMNELGRINFIDMEADKDASKGYDTRTRQVDPRNLNWFICRGVKYTVK